MSKPTTPMSRLEEIESHQKAYSKVVDEHIAAINNIISQIEGQLESPQLLKNSDHSSAQQLQMVSHHTTSKPASSLRSDSVKSRSSRISVLFSKQASLEASRFRLKYLYKKVLSRNK